MALSFQSCETLRKLLNLFVPWFYYLQNTGDIVLASEDFCKDKMRELT